jgi:hypothetical protein
MGENLRVEIGKANHSLCCTQSVYLDLRMQFCWREWLDQNAIGIRQCEYI